MASRKTLKVGIAGIGFMGVTHFNAIKSLKGVTVSAIAETDQRKQTGDWSQVRGNFGPGGGQVDLSNINVYSDYEAMAEDPDVDIIDLCLPTPLHRKAAVHCLRKGKHVLCEKPISLTLKDADAMLSASQASGRYLFVGHVLRYFPQYRFLKQAVDSGAYGKLLAARFRRIIARPNWSPGGQNWFSDPKKSGGAVIDLHIHDADFVIHLLGLPKAVSSIGVPSSAGAFDYISNQYDFGKNGPAVTTEGGWIATAALPFEQSYEVYFENATVLYNSSAFPVTLLLPNGKKVTAKLPKEDGFVAEWKAISAPLIKGEAPSELRGESARQALALCLAEQESARTGRKTTI